MADEEVFEVGDVVQAKSGGPKMTVYEVGEDMHGKNNVWCFWFDGTKKITGDFPPKTLLKF
jgi:uncharacterized protein YodC (DUF2158 family)